MDKFGIFKLLSSLFDFYNKNPPDLKANSKDDCANADQRENLPLEQKKEEGFLPLQQNMINTMKSHDDFVNRVRQKNQP